MYADKLHMNPGHENSRRPQDIESLHIVGSGWDGYYLVEYVCNFLLQQPESIQLDFYPLRTCSPPSSPTAGGMWSPPPTHRWGTCFFTWQNHRQKWLGYLRAISFPQNCRISSNVQMSKNVANWLICPIKKRII